MINEKTIKNILDGDIDCFSEIVGDYQQQIFAYIFRMIKNHQDAEDLTQDTFTKAYKNLSSLRQVEGLKTWLYQIAYRTTINYIRKQQIKSLNLFASPEQINSLEYQVDYSMGENSDLMTKIFSNLNHKEHTLLTLRVIEEMSYEEISQIMSASASALRKRYERLISKLNKTLSSDEEVGYEFG